MVCPAVFPDQVGIEDMAEVNQGLVEQGVHCVYFVRPLGNRRVFRLSPTVAEHPPMLS